MKKIIYLLIITVFFTFQIAKCKTTWQEIIYQSEDLIGLYFDTSSVKINDNYVYYRTRTIFAGDDFVCWLKSDCQKNLTSILKCKPYSKEVEENFYKYNDSKNMRSFDSTSPMYLFHNEACKLNTNTFSKTNKSKQGYKDYWTPYLLNLEKEIKVNWTPPKQSKSKLTVVKFSVEKNGNLKDLKIIKSSKNKEADNVALEAVKKTAPFKPLPKEFKGNIVPIEFYFKYNAINSKKNLIRQSK